MDCDDNPEFTALGSFAEFKNLLFLSIDLHLLTAIRPEKTPGNNTPFLKELCQSQSSTKAAKPPLIQHQIRYSSSPVQRLFGIGEKERVAMLKEFVQPVSSHSIRDLAPWIQFQRFWKVGDAQTGTARLERQINVCVSIRVSQDCGQRNGSQETWASCALCIRRWDETDELQYDVLQTKVMVIVEVA
ncbi:hypothetical protein PTMSG1_04757 [Pyrenophora teres f. maculata]|nr:hypothetical protein PTMSG1_04757 [Pyrenophora teres f. maculata]